MQLSSSTKGMTIIICHNKPPHKNEAGVWMTSWPEEMVLRIWGFWKDGSWDWTVEAESWILTVERERERERERVGFGSLKDVVGFFGSLTREILNITRCTARLAGVSIVRIVSLSSCRHGPKPGMNKRVRTWNDRVHLWLYLYCCYDEIIM